MQTGGAGLHLPFTPILKTAEKNSECHLQSCSELPHLLMMIITSPCTVQRASSSPLIGTLLLVFHHSCLLLAGVRFHTLALHVSEKKKKDSYDFWNLYGKPGCYKCSPAAAASMETYSITYIEKHHKRSVISTNIPKKLKTVFCVSQYHWHFIKSETEFWKLQVLHSTLLIFSLSCASWTMSAEKPRSSLSSAKDGRFWQSFTNTKSLSFT